MRCEYVNCDAEGAVIVVLQGRMYHMCKKHFRRLLRAMERRAKRREVSLDDFTVRKERGRIRLYFAGSKTET